MGDTTLWTLKKEEGRHMGVAVALWPMARWQVEPLQHIEISSGAESCLQPMEDSVLEEMSDWEEGRDSEGQLTGAVHL